MAMREHFAELRAPPPKAHDDPATDDLRYNGQSQRIHLPHVKGANVASSPLVTRSAPPRRVTLNRNSSAQSIELPELQWFDNPRDFVARRIQMLRESEEYRCCFDHHCEQLAAQRCKDQAARVNEIKRARLEKRIRDAQRPVIAFVPAPPAHTSIPTATINVAPHGGDPPATSEQLPPLTKGRASQAHQFVPSSAASHVSAHYALQTAAYVRCVIQHKSDAAKKRLHYESVTQKISDAATAKVLLTERGPLQRQWLRIVCVARSIELIGVMCNSRRYEANKEAEILIAALYAGRWMHLTRERQKKLKLLNRNRILRAALPRILTRVRRRLYGSRVDLLVRFLLDLKTAVRIPRAITHFASCVTVAQRYTRRYIVVKRVKRAAIMQFWERQKCSDIDDMTLLCTPPSKLAFMDEKGKQLKKRARRLHEELGLCASWGTFAPPLAMFIPVEFRVKVVDMFLCILAQRSLRNSLPFGLASMSIQSPSFFATETNFVSTNPKVGKKVEGAAAAAALSSSDVENPSKLIGAEEVLRLIRLTERAVLQHQELQRNARNKQRFHQTGLSLDSLTEAQESVANPNASFEATTLQMDASDLLGATTKACVVTGIRSGTQQWKFLSRCPDFVEVAKKVSLKSLHESMCGLSDHIVGHLYPMPPPLDVSDNTAFFDAAFSKGGTPPFLEMPDDLGFVEEYDGSPSAAAS